jgi:hypothetical protein
MCNVPFQIGALDRRLNGLNRYDQSTMGIDPMNNISIIIRILFAVTLFQQENHPPVPAVTIHL